MRDAKGLKVSALNFLAENYELPQNMLSNNVADSLVSSYLSHAESTKEKITACNFLAFVSSYVDVEALIRDIERETAAKAIDDAIGYFGNTLEEIKRLIVSDNKQEAIELINKRLKELK